VDESFLVHLATLPVHWIAIQVELHQICGRNQQRRQVTREEEAIGPLIMTHAHMPETVEDTFVSENAVCNNEVFDYL
jgi:hypothetical protein